MAYTIPEKLPGRSTVGEKQIFEILSRLPEDCIVYYEPFVGERNPDFIVILPSVGVLVIEVKGWYAGNIVRATPKEVVVNYRGRTTPHVHPLEQVREYNNRLRDHCRKNAWLAGDLLNGMSDRFVFPFGHFCVLSNIPATTLQEDSLKLVFPASRCVAKDRLQQWKDLSDTELHGQLQNCIEVHVFIS